MLFNAFCSPVYGCQVWFNFIKEPFRRIHVAFNNALRLLLKMPTWCCASQLFVQHGAITFLAAVRKQPFSLLRSLCSCNNDITQAFVSCDRFLVSPILAKWRNDLYVWLTLCIFVCVFVFFLWFFFFFFVFAWASSLFHNKVELSWV